MVLPKVEADLFCMPWGFTVLKLVAGLYVISDLLCEPFPVKIPCYDCGCLLLSEVSRYQKVMTALGYLCL